MAYLRVTDLFWVYASTVFNCCALAFVMYLVLYYVIKKPMFGETVISKLEPVKFR